jgi:hypothetical protein
MGKSDFPQDTTEVRAHNTNKPIFKFCGKLPKAQTVKKVKIGCYKMTNKNMMTPLSREPLLVIIPRIATQGMCFLWVCDIQQ